MYLGRYIISDWESKYDADKFNDNCLEQRTVKLENSFHSYSINIIKYKLDLYSDTNKEYGYMLYIYPAQNTFLDKNKPLSYLNFNKYKTLIEAKVEVDNLLDRLSKLTLLI
jgi:hypothetical protein